MKKQLAFALLLVLSLIMSALAQGGNGGGTTSTDTPSSGLAIGSTINDFELSDVSGHKHTLASLKGQKGTVLIFISVQCPVSNAYNERMEQLYQDYNARGINVVGINANATETADQAKHHAEEHHLTFTILKDKNNKVTDMLGATNTPEAFLFDANNKLVYRGRIDNSRSGDTISSSDLRDAIDAMLAGRAVARSYVRAFGCTIKRSSGE